MCLLTHFTSSEVFILKFFLEKEKLQKIKKKTMIQWNHVK